MGSKRLTEHRLETAATFRFPEPNFDEPPTRGFDGELTAEQLEWLVDKMADTTEYDALRRAGKSIRSFHEHHIGAGVIHRINPIEHEFGGASGIVEGLGLDDNHLLEIVHSSSHGITNCQGRLTYARLWKRSGSSHTVHIVCDLGELRTLLQTT